MNCVQCGEGLAASAKFCRKCGCQAPAPGLAQAASLSEAASLRGAAATPVAAYATCPDCGALCNGHAMFCKQCGCRFEENPGFEDTARDWDTPLSTAEEQAILVFGNVQDSSEPASGLPGERIQTSAAMVIGGTAAMSAAAVPAPALREPDAPLWQPEAARRPPGPSATAEPTRTPRSSASTRNPMPEAPVAASGSGLRMAVVLLGVVVLAAGGAWWWKSQQSRPAPGADVVTESAMPVAPPTVAPPAMVETDAALAPNETLVTPTLAAEAVADTSVAPVEADAAAMAPAPTPAPARAAVRKPARPQTLDDLLN